MEIYFLCLDSKLRVLQKYIRDWMKYFQYKHKTIKVHDNLKTNLCHKLYKQSEQIIQWNLQCKLLSAEDKLNVVLTVNIRQKLI